MRASEWFFFFIPPETRTISSIYLASIAFFLVVSSLQPAHAGPNDGSLFPRGDDLYPLSSLNLHPR